MPVSETQDAIGPITRTVTRSAASGGHGWVRSERSLDGMELRQHTTSYVQFLKSDGLRGARIGLLKTLLGSGPEHQEVNSVIATAIVTLKSAEPS